MSSRSGDMGPGCMALFGLPFLGAGLFVIGLFASAFLDWQRAESWDRVPATIEQVELQSHRGSKGGTTWSVNARYSYEAGGRKFTGTRVSPDVGSSSDESHRQRYEELKRHHDSGEPFRAWVDPANPEESMLYREMALMSWALLPFGTIFALVGAGISCAGVRGVFRGLRRRRRLAADPRRPWRADGRWGDGFSLGATAGSSLLLGWGCAAFLVLFVGMFVWVVFTQETPPAARVVIGLFALAPAGALCWAAYATARFLKYGSVRLVLAEMPVVPGRTIAGAVFCPRRIEPEKPFKLRLRCVRSVRRNKSSSSQTLHDATVEVAAERALQDFRGGTGIPVEIPVPAELPPTSAPYANPTLIWTLSVSAATPGVDFAAEFCLPVYQVEDESLIESRPRGAE